MKDFQTELQMEMNAATIDCSVIMPSYVAKTWHEDKVPKTLQRRKRFIMKI